MSMIRAFVGHSFTEDDASVVRTFLDYFATLADSALPFTWEHAEKAEPHPITAKVVRMMADKELFIGICTKKEQALTLRSRFSSFGFLWAKEAEVQFKTSDWIIQEIGMAIGRGMKLMLLVEEGVRTPGGLQADTEYISFTRASPEKSFPKIVQMISKLSPSKAVALITASETTSAKDEPSAERLDLANPTEDWSRRHYEFAILDRAFSDDEAGIEKINRAYLETSDALSGDNRITWETHIAWARLHAGKGGSLNRVKELADLNPKNSKVIEYLARAFSHYKERTRSAEAYIAAAAATDDVERKAVLWRAAAKQYIADKDFVKAQKMADQIRQASSGAPPILITFAGALLDIAKAQDNFYGSIAAMERILELKPDDIDTRFNIALKQSEKENNDLALHHYLKIPFQDRSPAAWNNIGVTFEQLKLSGKAVEAYRRAAGMEETLAMSNLGNKLLGVGFVNEAREQCEAALKIENPHKNVGELLARATELPELEDKRQDQILETSKPKVEFYRKLGEAVSAGDVIPPRPKWAGPDCILEMTRIGDEVSLVGEFERDPNPFGLALLGSNPYSTSPPSKIKHRIRFVGTIQGGAIFGTVIFLVFIDTTSFPGSCPPLSDKQHRART